jgi:arginyl-tRNA synthetase
MLTRIKHDISPVLAATLGLPEEDVRNSLESPKAVEHGELAMPVFALAKTLKKAPPLIAKEKAAELQGKIPNVASVEAVGGYLNFKFERSYVQNMLEEETRTGSIAPSGAGKGKRIVMDYSSPNIAKPMSIGHLRATVIGQAIRNLGLSQGYEVIGINHLGDWGVQFGKLAWAYTQWGKEYDFAKKPFDSLYQIYVRFHEEAEKNPEYDKEGAAYFKRLEAGDEEVKKIWKYFIDVSLKEYDRIYGMLGIKFDLIQGEAFYNDQLVPTINKIKKAGILVESEGAQVVFVSDNEKDPPCIIVKSDGTSLYATRDLASAIYRKEVLKGDKILYVVGVDQTLHFNQVFGVLAKMGYPWAADCHHISFGMYRFKDEGKMSTRRGRVIFMDDVLEKAIEIVQKIIAEKNPEMPNKDKIAEQVGVGAIIFNDLMNDRVKNVDFDWEKVLDFEGDSGPYVQYCQVRCNSLIKKYGEKIERKFSVDLESPEERDLVKHLLSYDEALASSFRTFRPNIVAQYLLDLCRAFNHFYQKHRVLDGEANLKASRMLLIQITRDVIRDGLKVLGIASPEAM